MRVQSFTVRTNYGTSVHGASAIGGIGLFRAAPPNYRDLRFPGANSVLVNVLHTSILVAQAANPGVTVTFGDTKFTITQGSKVEECIQNGVNDSARCIRVNKAVESLRQGSKRDTVSTGIDHHLVMALAEANSLEDEAGKQAIARAIVRDRVGTLFDIYSSYPDRVLPTTPKSFVKLSQAATPEPIPAPDPVQIPIAPQSPSEDLASTPADHSRSEREEFADAVVSAIKFTVDAATGGIIGNFVYEVLKAQLRRLTDLQNEKRKNRYAELIRDIEERAAQSHTQQTPQPEPQSNESERNIQE